MNILSVDIAPELAAMLGPAAEPVVPQVRRPRAPKPKREPRPLIEPSLRSKHLKWYHRQMQDPAWRSRVAAKRLAKYHASKGAK